MNVTLLLTNNLLVSLVIHLGKDAFYGSLRDLQADGEKEFGAFAKLRLNLHVAVHEQDETLGVG